MRQIGKITIKPGSDFWKSLQQEAEQDAEKEAAAAADRVRKEAMARAEKRAAEKKAYLDSIVYFDKVEFKTQHLKDQIQKHREERARLDALSSQEWSQEELVRKELRQVCTHDMVIEHRTSWKDDYDDWHDGNYERKCIECFLVEESEYEPGDRRYKSSSKRYNKLEKSRVVLLRKVVNNQEFELEFNDLK